MAWLDILVNYLEVLSMLIIPVTLFVYLEYDLKKEYKKFLQENRRSEKDDKEEDGNKETENKEEKL